MTDNAVPERYHSVTPYLVLKNAKEAIAFYERAFGARDAACLYRPDGKVGHAEIKIGDSPIMLADEMPEMGISGPESFGGSPINLLIYVPDVDAAFARAIAAGGEEIRPVQDQFYGDRSGVIKDLFGYVWSLATHVEDVPLDELQRRMDAVMGG